MGVVCHLLLAVSVVCRCLSPVLFAIGAVCLWFCSPLALLAVVLFADALLVVVLPTVVVLAVDLFAVVL